MPLAVFLAAPAPPLRRTVSLGVVQKAEGFRKSTDGSDLVSNVSPRNREIGSMGLKRKRSSLPRQLTSYFGFEEEEEGEAEDVGEASIWYSPSPHPSVSFSIASIFQRNMRGTSKKKPWFRTYSKQGLGWWGVKIPELKALNLNLKQKQALDLCAGDEESKGFGQSPNKSNFLDHNIQKGEEGSN